MNPIIVTERLVLRRPRATDWPAVRAFLLSDRSGVLLPEKTEYSAWLSYAVALGHWDLCGFGLFMALSRETHNPVGMFGPWFPCSWPEPEMAWHLFCDKDEGGGLAFEAASAVLEHLFTSRDFSSIVSFVDPNSPRSLALAERLGGVRDPQARRPDDPTRANVITFRHKRAP